MGVAVGRGQLFVSSDVPCRRASAQFFHFAEHHVTEEMIRKERLEVLRATQQDIRNLADIVEKVLQADQICVIGNEDKIEQEKEIFTEVKALF